MRPFFPAGKLLILSKGSVFPGAQKEIASARGSQPAAGSLHSAPQPGQGALCRGDHGPLVSSTVKKGFASRQPDSDGGLGDHPQPPLLSAAGLICLAVTFPSVADVAA